MGHAFYPIVPPAVKKNKEAAYVRFKSTGEKILLYIKFIIIRISSNHRYTEKIFIY